MTMSFDRIEERGPYLSKDVTMKTLMSISMISFSPKRRMRQMCRLIISNRTETSKGRRGRYHLNTYPSERYNLGEEDT